MGRTEGVFAQYKHIWKDKGVKMKLKVRLADALILSILLYNCENWVLNKKQMNTLEKFQDRMLKKMTRGERWKQI